MTIVDSDSDSDISRSSFELQEDLQQDLQMGENGAPAKVVAHEEARGCYGGEPRMLPVKKYEGDPMEFTDFMAEYCRYATCYD